MNRLRTLAVGAVTVGVFGAGLLAGSLGGGSHRTAKKSDVTQLHTTHQVPPLTPDTAGQQVITNAANPTGGVIPGTSLYVPAGVPIPGLAGANYTVAGPTGPLPVRQIDYEGYHGLGILTVAPNGTVVILSPAFGPDLNR
jgi:hypothetical protein